MRLSSLCVAGCAATSTSGSPVQKVIKLLDSLSSKITAEGDAEGRQYDKFVEWCEDNAKELQHEVAQAVSEVEDLNAAIEQADSGIETSNSRISDLSESIAEDEAELEKATKMREEERKAWASQDGELAETIDTLSNAISVLKRQLAAGLLQTNRDAVEKLQETLPVLLDGSMFAAHDTEQVKAFLQSSHSEANNGDASKTIIQVLDDMLEKAEGQRATATKAETEAKFNFEMVKQTLTQRGATQNKELVDVKKSLAAHSESKATATADLQAAQKDQASDQAALQSLQVDCMQTATDHEASVQGRSEELKALAAAKKIIQEKTGAADSRGFLLQLSTSTAEAEDTDNVMETVRILRGLGRKQGNMEISLLASKAANTVAQSSGADVFAKVKNLIEGMIAKLEEEALKEGKEKAYCDKEMKETEAKKAEHEEDLGTLDGKINKAESSIASLTDKIATLESELGNIASSQQEMDALRAEEHTEYAKSRDDYAQGVEGVQMAIKVLKEYYGQAFLQQPTVSTHSADGGAASGIIGLLEVAESDFSKLLAEVEADEKSAQTEYEQQTKENELSKTEKQTELKYKTKEKAETEKDLEELKADRDGEQSELDAVLDYYSGIKKRCIAKPEPYEERKRRREQEIEGLKQALDVLENETAFLSLKTVKHHI